MKQILTLLLFCLLTDLFNPAYTAAQDSEVLVPDPGVVSYTFRTQFADDVPGTLDMIKEMGFTNIEFSNLFGKSASEMRSLLDERGLICTSYGVSYDNLVNNTETVAEEAGVLGASYVRVAWIPHESPFDIDDAMKAIEDFEAAGKYLKDHNISFSYHNHGYEFRPYGDGTLFDYLVQNSNPEYVNFQLDTFWVAQPGHDPVKLLETYPNRFNLVHLKDLKKGVEHDYSGGAPAEYDVPLGTGQIDLERLLRAAKHSNIEYFYIEDESDDVISRVPRGRDYIKSISK